MNMVFLGIDVGSLPWVKIGIIAAVAIAFIIVVAVLINKGRYTSRYKHFYKKIDKTINKNKRYNGNLLNETLVSKNLLKDETNTYKSLKGKGKRMVRNYLDYYVKNLPQLVLFKSFISADKKKASLVIMYLNELNKVVFRWDASKKTKGLIKGMNKHQMLMPTIGFLFEVPMQINEGVPYRITNHDNGTVVSYDIVKDAKHIRRKQKEKPLSKKQIKAQAKIEALKEKRLAKQKHR